MPDPRPESRTQSRSWLSWRMWRSAAWLVWRTRGRGWERTLSYLPNLRFQAIRWGCLKGCGGQAQSERERNKRIQTQKRWSRKKGGQNCAAYAALRREDGPARGGGQGDFSRNCGWAVQVRGADGPEHQAKQEGHPNAGRHSTGQPQVESPGGIQTPIYCVIRTI